MEKTIVAIGKTIDLAVESALTQLGLDRDSVSVLVLQQAKAGFLGFGAQPAKVQVTYEAPDPVVVPEKPKSALGSASRSKPKAKPVPEKKPEAPKAEPAPKAEKKAEAPKAEQPKKEQPKKEKKAEAPKAPKAPKENKDFHYQTRTVSGCSPKLNALPSRPHTLCALAMFIGRVASQFTLLGCKKFAASRNRTKDTGIFSPLLYQLS